MGFLASLWAAIITFLSNKPMPQPTPTPVPEPAPMTPKPPMPAPTMPAQSLLRWDSATHARYSVRVLCDDAGLSVADKNILCGVVGAESGWLNYYPTDYTTVSLRGLPVTHKNPTSTDWGICQINDHYHIGAGKDFPSVEYVLANPEETVKWMIKMYKAGLIHMWNAYLNGSYKKFM